MLFTQTLQLSSCFHPSTLEVLLETLALFQHLLPPLEPRRQAQRAHSERRVVLG
jgi:hypothetical protein